MYFVYSVMHSDGSSFCGDVVLDSYNIAYRDKDSILDQIFSAFYYEDLEFEEWFKKMHF